MNDVSALAEANDAFLPITNNHLPTLYQHYIYLSRYSRWLDDEGRRETWTETVSRYFNFMQEHLIENNNFNSADIRGELEEAVLNLSIMPSMRALMTSGPALKRENIAGFNCAFVAVDSPRAFDEILYVLMNGTGVGFSVEEKSVRLLPIVADEFHSTETKIVVEDSKIGWAKAFKQLISLLYAGEIPSWDVSKVRAAGFRLKTFGGRASGPEPLVGLFKFSVELFKRSAGRKLTTLECHDLVCKIAEIVVVGGVRRSALISLSDLNDDRMRSSKSGLWWEQNVQRALANNSAVYNGKPEIKLFMKEWLSLVESDSGERGIFNRKAAQHQVAKNGRRDNTFDFGMNPCGEILLRNNEFCNLSEVVIRENDTFETLKEKVRLATIVGTYQSTLTNFKYLNKRWKRNCDEERLLGVSLTGIMDNVLTNGSLGHDVLGDALNELKKVAIATNKEWAAKFGIPASAAILCVKPSGTVSQLVDSASGIHARHDPFYIRRVRGDIKDPLAQFMIDNGFVAEPDVTKPNHTVVFSFPIKAPEGAVLRSHMTAIEQLEIWKVYRNNWCEHNPSTTISVKSDEWLEVGAWVYKNFDDICGLSFLPYADHIYQQAPYETITETEYNGLLEKLPKYVDWSQLVNYEKFDTTTGTQELACTASGGCEI